MENVAKYHGCNFKKCSFCYKKGHSDDKCYKNHPALRPNSQKETKANLPETNGNKEITFRYDAKGLMSSRDNVKKDYFYFDFACTWPMTGNKHWLKEIKCLTCRGDVSVKVGSGKPSAVIGIGKVSLVVLNSKEELSQFQTPDVRLMKNF